MAAAICDVELAEDTVEDVDEEEDSDEGEDGAASFWLLFISC